MLVDWKARRPNPRVIRSMERFNIRHFEFDQASHREADEHQHRLP
jgi:hypothetical protein